MTGLFDGVAGLLTDVFGGSVTHTPSGGPPVPLKAIFRREPVTTVDREGFEAFGLATTLQVPRQQAATLSRGDVIAPGDGHTYIVGAQQPSGSPAIDAFVVFELERSS